MKPGYTYIMGSFTGALCIGVTSDIDVRIRQHSGAGSSSPPTRR
jgi:predicted GIY-YIG superfamily endonuclease